MEFNLLICYRKSGSDDPNSDNLFVVYFKEEFINSMGETLEMECRMSNYDCLGEYKCFANDFFESFNKRTIQHTWATLVVTFYFIGYAVGALAFALPDQIGRKRSCIYGFIICLVSETTMLLVPNYSVRLIGFFCIGAS